MTTIRCFYTCHGCGLLNVSCDVAARSEEGVVDWMRATVLQIAANHRRRSPHCRARELQELKIPMTGVERIGGPAVQ